MLSVAGGAVTIERINGVDGQGKSAHRLGLVDIITGHIEALVLGLLLVVLLAVMVLTTTLLAMLVGHDVAGTGAVGVRESWTAGALMTLALTVALRAGFRVRLWFHCSPTTVTLLFTVRLLLLHLMILRNEVNRFTVRASRPTLRGNLFVLLVGTASAD